MPMKLPLPNAPATLAAVALFGGLTTAGSFFVILPVRLCGPGSIAPLFWFLAVVATLGAGFYLEMQAESKLRDGIAFERWTADELSPLRRVFRPRFFVPVSIALLAAAVVLLIFDRHHSGRVWPFILLSQSLTRVVGVLKEPRPGAPRPDWRSFAPIHSDNWGRR